MTQKKFAVVMLKISVDSEMEYLDLMREVMELKYGEVQSAYYRRSES